jgi:hypothetical protein
MYCDAADLGCLHMVRAATCCRCCCCTSSRPQDLS